MGSVRGWALVYGVGKLDSLKDWTVDRLWCRVFCDHLGCRRAPSLGRCQSCWRLERNNCHAASQRICGPSGGRFANVDAHSSCF